jgi:glycosyltransferase involved in cell wall biosynthesis
LERPQAALARHLLGLRLIYFAPADVQIARVDRNCIVKFCEAMAEGKADVTLVSLGIKVLDTEPTAHRTIWDVFGVTHEFRLVRVKLPLRQERLGSRWGSVLVKMARTTAYPAVAFRLMLRGRRSSDTMVLYCKNFGLVPGLRLARRVRRPHAAIVFEAHRPPRNRFQKWALKRVDGIVCNGNAAYQALLAQGFARPERSIAVHQGYSPGAYPLGSRTRTRDDARRRLGWNKTDRVAVYTGKVYWPYPEVDLLVQAAVLMAQDGIRLLVVGGRADHAQRWREEILSRHLDNVSFAGFVAPSAVADYQVAADVLISYYPSGIELNDYRSPGKLFEYMASGTPMVAADYSALREVLRDEHNALLVEPDQPETLAKAVCRLVGDPSLAARLGDQARQDALQYTWAARARSISAFVAALESA